MYRRQRDSRVHQQVTAADINFILQHESDRFPGRRFRQIAVKGDDARHGGFHPRRQHFQALSYAHAAGGNRTGEPAEVEVRAVDVLHREAQRLAFHHALNLNGFQHFQQRRAAVPRHFIALAGDVVPFKRGKRDKANVEIAWQLFSKGQIRFTDGVKGLFAKIDEVHFVHRHHQVFDPQQRGDKAVTTGLIEYAFAGVDQQDRQVAG